MMNVQHWALMQELTMQEHEDLEEAKESGASPEALKKISAIQLQRANAAIELHKTEVSAMMNRATVMTKVSQQAQKDALTPEQTHEKLQATARAASEELSRKTQMVAMKWAKKIAQEQGHSNEDVQLIVRSAVMHHQMETQARQQQNLDMRRVCDEAIGQKCSEKEIEMRVR